MVYLEPFCGSGAVFFNKNPGAVETINDLDSDVVNLFQVLREQPEALKKALELTPYSREEYEKSYEACEDPLEKARRYLVKVNQCIGARLGYHSSWRNYVEKNPGGSLAKWGNITQIINPAAMRLRGSTTNLVQIEHMDALRLIERYNNPEVLMYLDPPYVRSARKSGKLYRYEMDNEQQKKLLALIVQSKAKTIISGYDSDLYNTALQGWYKDSVFSQTTSAVLAEEIIWQNFEPSGQLSLFSERIKSG